MYSRLNYISGEYYEKEILHYESDFRKQYEACKKASYKSLKEFICDNGSINGDELQSNWFEPIDANIFISHAHEDKDKAIALAGWIYDKFRLTSFIDSAVWGYCDKLLAELDNMYCKCSDSKNYNYYLRNYSTSHVHIMLASALAQMIDNTECILFLNTPESISFEETIHDMQLQYAQTRSPWIYYELAISTMVKKTKPNRLKENYNSHVKKKVAAKAKKMIINRKVNKYLDQMVNLTDEDLEDWADTHSNSEYPLDSLYEILNVK